MPRVIETILGRGIITVLAFENQTAFIAADSLSSQPDDEVFLLWKQKFLKHEEAHAVIVNYEFRNERRQLKT